MTRSGLRLRLPSKDILRAFWKVSQNGKSRVFPLLYRNILLEMEWSRHRPPQSLFSRLKTRRACFRKRCGEDIVNENDMPSAAPQAWSWAMSREHLLLRAVYFNPLKDLSANQAWNDVLWFSKRFLRGLSWIGQAKNKLIHMTRYN